MKLVLPTGSHPRPCGGVHQKEATLSPEELEDRRKRREEAAAKRKRLVRGRGRRRKKQNIRKSACVLFDGVINKAEGSQLVKGLLLHSEPTVKHHF